MAKRYELPDAAWDLVADIFYEPRRSGRPRTDDCLMLNGILCVLCSGAAWRDMPEHFGPWSTVYLRFRDWRNRGAFDQMLKRLHSDIAYAQLLLDDAYISNLRGRPRKRCRWLQAGKGYDADA